jgi:hypothetical protein
MLHSRNLFQCSQADSSLFGYQIEADLYEYSVFVNQRDDVAYRPHGNKIEVFP